MSWPAPTGDPVRSGEETTQGGTPAPNAQESNAVVPGHQPDAPIATLAPAATTPVHLAAINERTGRPVRPWNVWVASVLLFAAAGAVTVGLLLAMWTMSSPGWPDGDGWMRPDTFNQATWLTGRFPTEESSGWRVFLAILSAVITVIVAGTASVVGYYSFAGYRWTRIGGLVAVGASLLSLLITPIAAIAIPLAAVGAGLLWLPSTQPFFARWHQLRHPQIAYSEPVSDVFYGPLPRYR